MDKKNINIFQWTTRIGNTTANSWVCTAAASTRVPLHWWWPGNEASGGGLGMRLVVAWEQDYSTVV